MRESCVKKCQEAFGSCTDFSSRPMWAIEWDPVYKFLLTWFHLFVLAVVGLWFFLLLPFALWWRRLRGLWKLPDVKDWQWGKLGLAVVGRALQLLPTRSCLAWGNPALVYGLYGWVNGKLQEVLCQGGPSRTAAASSPDPADLHLHGRPPNTSR